ncbi:MAG: cysteine dioxygenase family protein [Acidobacteria bacterium]|nr:cysteine dioxygenase family protein [Acidobacteriota bacterium]
MSSTVSVDLQTDALTITDFVQRLTQLDQNERTPEVIAALFQQVQSFDPEVELHVTFSRQKYTRNLFFRNEDFEILIMCWEPGQGTLIHDHDGSFTVDKIYSGSLHCIEYQRIHPDSSNLEETRTTQLTPGDVMVSSSEDIHRVANISDQTPAVSIHLYAPPLKRMNCFNLETGTTWIVIP